ncbi:hypothetical protein OC842_004850 [Tilletia horrida]|uniref:Cutinase n=1 Tax=Tilletia horrida TaxID=155126 RepID=A0AAN6JIY3_9BASI|nr:hypothetical protein OC842_004850 [Tilletia horrida]
MIVFTLLLPFVLAVTTVRTTPTAGCKDYVILSSRGTGELQGPSISMMRMIASTLSAVPNGAEVDTTYPADATMNAQVGANWNLDYINKGRQACPAQKYVLIGYSQGAMVASLTLQQLVASGTAQDAIKAVVLLGNPYHTPGRTGNVDGHGGSGTLRAFGVAYALKPASIDSFVASGRLLDICLYGDVICSAQASLAPAAHLQYGLDDSVQQLASSFIIEKLRA